MVGSDSGERQLSDLIFSRDEIVSSMISIIATFLCFLKKEDRNQMCRRWFKTQHRAALFCAIWSP